jgi:hypothetical protein
MQFHFPIWIRLKFIKKQIVMLTPRSQFYRYPRGGCGEDTRVSTGLAIMLYITCYTDSIKLNLTCYYGFFFLVMYIYKIFFNCKGFQTFFPGLLLNKGARGGVVVEALRHKPEGRWFDSRRCHWIFSST